MQPSRTLWLDADPGLDDWLTLLLLSAEVDLTCAGMGVVAGNAPLVTTLDNALRIRALHRLQLPIHAGAAHPLNMQLQTAQHILGAQGMRTTGPELEHTLQPCDDMDAVAALLQHLRQSSAPTTLVATGPLTNVAQALLKDREAMNGVSEIVWMGGSTDVGNQTPVAEFNAFADPEALAMVLASGLPIRMFGLNLCRQLLLTREHVQALKALPGPVAACVAGYVEAYQRIRSADGSEPMPLYDPVVALWLMQPDLFEFRPLHVEVELEGRLTRGMTVCDMRRKPSRMANVQVAMHVRAQDAMALFMQKLTGVLAAGALQQH